MGLVLTVVATTAIAATYVWVVATSRGRRTVFRERTEMSPADFRAAFYSSMPDVSQAHILTVDDYVKLVALASTRSGPS